MGNASFQFNTARHQQSSELVCVDFVKELMSSGTGNQMEYQICRERLRVCGG